MTRNARKMQPAIGCQVVVDPSSLVQQQDHQQHHQQHHQQQHGPARPQNPNNSNDHDKSSQWASLLSGKLLEEAFSVGKELFLIFADNVALRLHFGMNGSLILQQPSSSSVNQNKWYALKQQSRSLRLYFQKESAACTATGREGITAYFPKVDNQNSQKNATTKDSMTPSSPPTLLTLECFSTTVSQVSIAVAHSKRTRLLTLDVCAPVDVFDPTAVRSALKTRPPHTLISDALLDQSKFPGVGNIIKIEGLHAAKIHPQRTVEHLKDDELDSAIEHCRQYAMEWLRQGRGPPKRVYNETNCGSCQTQGSVRMVKLGHDLKRVTFWCDLCQPRDPSSSATRKRPLTEISQPVYASSSKHPRQQPPASTFQQQEQHQPPQQYGNTRNNQGACCPQHGERSFCVKRVRHKEVNKHRLFGSCRHKACPYFVWMDTHFPNCPSCHKKTILRVSKKEQSSGRWFFSCSSTTCKKGMFAWATPPQLEPLGRFLTPLL